MPADINTFNMLRPNVLAGSSQMLLKQELIRIAKMQRMVADYLVQVTALIKCNDYTSDPK